jgi:DNA-binding Lrp family transcriptional regulator
MDEIDFRILKILSDNCRTPYEMIAKGVGLTGNAVRKRVEDMMDRGIIDRFFLCVSPAALGYNTIIAVFEHGEEAFDELSKGENVMFVIGSVNGVGAAVFLFRPEESWREGLGAIFKKIGSARLVSAFVYEEAIQGTKAREIDRKIMRSMKDDVRKPVSDIADELKISTKTVRRHLDYLASREIMCPMVLIQPWNMDGIVPYYLFVEFEEELGTERVISCFDKKFDKCWFRQKVGGKPIFLLQLYARSFREIEEQRESLHGIEGVKNAIFFYPSRVYFSDRYAKEGWGRIMGEC